MWLLITKVTVEKVRGGTHGRRAEGKNGGRHRPDWGGAGGQPSSGSSRNGREEPTKSKQRDMDRMKTRCDESSQAWTIR